MEELFKELESPAPAPKAAGSTPSSFASDLAGLSVTSTQPTFSIGGDPFGGSQPFGAHGFPPTSQAFGQPPTSQAFGQPPTSQAFGQPFGAGQPFGGPGAGQQPFGGQPGFGNFPPAQQGFQQNQQPGFPRAPSPNPFGVSCWQMFENRSFYLTLFV